MIDVGRESIDPAMCCGVARSSNRGIGWMLVLAALFGQLVGCGRMPTDYGFTSGIKGRNSLNGFSALRQSFENAGCDCDEVHRLSDRLDRTDTIVWIPQTLEPIDSSLTFWFEDWLAQEGHTLVYLVPDSGSEVDYWMTARESAPPEQVFEYRRRAARAINERFSWRLNRSSVPSNGWFQLDPLRPALPIDRVEGAWSRSIEDSIAVEGTRSEAPHGTLELRVESYQPPPASPAGATTTAAPTNYHVGPTGPNDPFHVFSSSATNFLTETTVEFQPLLSAVADGAAAGSGGGAGAIDQTIAARITSSEWPKSQIIVIAGGSLLTNYAFTRPFTRGLADRVVESATDPQAATCRVGFLTTNQAKVPISNVEPGAPSATGMELLTQWPLSLVTVHAVFLGIVACLMLFPIFGRPRQLIRSSLSHFGDHLDAVAALMSKTRGETFARQRISEYHRRMRGETSGRWVVPETPPVVVRPPAESPPTRPEAPPIEATRAEAVTPGAASLPSAASLPGAAGGPPVDTIPPHEKLRDES